jgi:sporulation protein YlmC with PRC-barrel domain
MTSLDLTKAVLDHQLIDRDGRRCGNVDDLELDGDPGSPLRVVAILSGPGTWRQRLPRILRGPLGWPLERLFGTGVSRIDWSDVKRVAAAIELEITAESAGLGRGDDIAANVVKRIPGA